MNTESSDPDPIRSANRQASDQRLSEPETRSRFEELADQKQGSLLGEIVQFIIENKYWWLIPIVVSLAGFGILLILSYTGAAPFIYTLF